jgi:hypothetical protein
LNISTKNLRDLNTINTTSSSFYTQNKDEKQKDKIKLLNEGNKKAKKLNEQLSTLHSKEFYEENLKRIKNN